MKVVHVVNADIRGGAPKAAFALSKALQDNGVDSKLLVQRKFSNDNNVFSINTNYLEQQKTNFRMLVDLLQMKVFTQTRKGRFSFGRVGTDITNNELIKQSDIIHLHWINEGYLSLKSLLELGKINKPIFWTLHDMWGFTGGCHYSSGCKRYMDSCGQCPYLKYPSKKDFSFSLLNEKKLSFNELDITFLTCSEWLGSVASNTMVLKEKEVIPLHNTLFMDIYKPINRESIRSKFNFPNDKFIIIFVSLTIEDERKGFIYLKKSLIELLKMNPELADKVELLILGSYAKNWLAELPCKINAVGRISDDKSMAEYYNVADVFLAPSLEDNLPNTVLESLSCGTPVVGFNIGGIPEMVEHKKNGYLAKEKSVEDFTNGILWMIQNKKFFKELRKNARLKVEKNFNPTFIAKKHLDLYEKRLTN